MILRDAVNILEFISYCENTEIGFDVDDMMFVTKIYFLDRDNQQQAVDMLVAIDKALPKVQKEIEKRL